MRGIGWGGIGEGGGGRGRAGCRSPRQGHHTHTGTLKKKKLQAWLANSLVLLPWQVFEESLKVLGEIEGLIKESLRLDVAAPLHVKDPAMLAQVPAALIDALEVSGWLGGCMTT